MNADWRTRYDFAMDVAHQAGQFALQYYNQGIAVEWKADHSPVTLADRGAEQLLRSAIASKFPGDGFLGEEFGDTPGTSGYRWIVDPIDGTRSFVRGLPIWATLVGLEYKGELIAGVAYAPALGQTHRALRGDGAYCDNRRIRVSDVATLDKSHVYYSSIAWFKKAKRDKQFLKLVDLTERQRGVGDYYCFMLVAQGAGEIAIEYGVHAWDIAALAPIVEEAGGKFTSWNGAFDLNRPDVLATNGKMHAETLRVINEPV